MDAAACKTIVVIDGLTAILSRTEDVIDVTGIVLVKGDSAKGDPAGNGQVDHALDLAARPAVSDHVALDVDPAAGDAKLRLVRNEADRARFA